jgi:hypothetical protein
MSDSQPSTIVAKVASWPFQFGGEPHSGWLPPNAALPLPTPIEPAFLEVVIEAIDGGFLLIWRTLDSLPSDAQRPPKGSDTWHPTVADAMKSASTWFGIREDDWAVTDVGRCR